LNKRAANKKERKIKGPVAKMGVKGLEMVGARRISALLPVLSTWVSREGGIGSMKNG